MSGRRARLVLATRNADKAREIRAIYAHLDLEILTLDGWPELGELPEDAATYAANASTKAEAAAQALGLPALADDSGIEIDALEGALGPHSRRFLGAHATDADRNAKVLELLAAVPDAKRTARYRAAVAIALPRGPVRVFEGTCEGTVARSPRGRAGFGYDPVFVVTPDGRTMAELSFDEKNQISHRARALRAAEAYLRSVLVAPREERCGPGANTSTGPLHAAGSAAEPPAPPAADDSASGGRR